MPVQEGIFRLDESQVQSVQLPEGIEIWVDRPVILVVVAVDWDCAIFRTDNHPNVVVPCVIDLPKW